MTKFTQTFLIILKFRISKSEPFCDYLGTIAYKKPVFVLDVITFELLHFLKHSFHIDYTSISDDIRAIWMEHSRWK